MTARRLSEREIDAIIAQRRASAEAAMRGRAHRALPLAEVERRARAKRQPWPSCSGDCNQGRKPCDCPTGAASACSEFLADPPRPKPPAYPWRDLGAGLLVLLFAVSYVHVIATATQPVQKVAKR